MAEQVTKIRRLGGSLHAFCPVHGAVGVSHTESRKGRSAAMLDARAHDDVVHGIYRSEWAYENAERSVE